MIRPFRVLAVLAVPVLLVATAHPAAAQGVVAAPAYCAPPVVSYYSPPAVSYYAPPAVSYYAAPSVAYYPAPTVTYYSPAPVYYAPSAVTTYYRYGLFGRRVGATTYYYP
jgi:hypothetical protein